MEQSGARGRVLARVAQAARGERSGAVARKTVAGMSRNDAAMQ